MNKRFFIFPLTAILLLCGCKNDLDFAGGVEEKGKLYSTFDYSSVFECNVTLELGKRSYAYIYDQNPDDNPEAQPIRSIMTDAFGGFQCRLQLPTAIIGKKIYAVIGDETISAYVDRSGVRLVSDKSRDCTLESRVLLPEADYCNQLKDFYQKKLPQGNGKADNRNLLEETGETSVSIRYENTNVMFTFLLTNGWNTNYMYYYYYWGEDQATEENRQEYIDKFCTEKYLCTRGWQVRIDNVINNPDNDDITELTEGGNGGINRRFKQVGVSNILYYYGEDYNQEASVNFPKGVNIGFILKSVDHSERASETPDENKVKYFFSTPKANTPDFNQNRIHTGRFWSSSETEEVENITRFVYGFEDGMKEKANDPNHDYNFNDFLFLLSTNPQANTLNVASLTSTSETDTGTLMYEDLFPDQGDYDMNDVIFEYRMRKNYETHNGQECIVDMYVDITPMHYGADYDDYIYVRCLKNDGTSLCPPIKADFQREFGMSLRSVAAYNKQILSESVNPEFKTIRLYFIKGRKVLGDGEVVDYPATDFPFKNIDPFIYVADTNREVHLTGYSNAGIGSENGLTENQKIYRAMESVDGFYPWAMKIPMKSAGMHNPGFTPVTESVNICREYLGFGEWVSTNGTSSTDWYEHYSEWTPPIAR